MYKYEYETIRCELGGWGFGSGNIYSIDDYRSIINRRAEDGYLQMVPIRQSGQRVLCP